MLKMVLCRCIQRTFLGFTLMSLIFFQFKILVFKGDTDQFLGEITAVFIKKPSRSCFHVDSKVCFRGMRTDLSI